jgi:predicted esterase
MQAKKLGFVHRFLPKSKIGPDWTVLLLHGTGADENDRWLGQELAPDAALLGPRGKVLENGLPRFSTDSQRGFSTREI